MADKPRVIKTVHIPEVDKYLQDGYEIHSIVPETTGEMGDYGSYRIDTTIWYILVLKTYGEV